MALSRTECDLTTKLFPVIQLKLLPTARNGKAPQRPHSEPSTKEVKGVGDWRVDTIKLNEPQLFVAVFFFF